MPNQNSIPSSSKITCERLNDKYFLICSKLVDQRRCRYKVKIINRKFNGQTNFILSLRNSKSVGKLKNVQICGKIKQVFFQILRIVPQKHSRASINRPSGLFKWDQGIYFRKRSKNSKKRINMSKIISETHAWTKTQIPKYC